MRINELVSFLKKYENYGNLEVKIGSYDEDGHRSLRGISEVSLEVPYLFADTFVVLESEE